MAEFNWTVDDIERAQRDFSYNFMRLDCIRTESYDVAIDCMTECIEKKTADVQPARFARWIDLDNRILCSRCGAGYDDSDEVKQNTYIFCPNCGARMDGDTNG